MGKFEVDGSCAAQMEARKVARNSAARVEMLYKVSLIDHLSFRANHELFCDLKVFRFATFPEAHLCASA